MNNNDSYTMMAKPIRFLELHHLMTKFLIIMSIPGDKSSKGSSAAMRPLSILNKSMSDKDKSSFCTHLLCS